MNRLAPRAAKLLLVFAALVALCHTPQAVAATCNSVAAVNNWSAVATWSCGHIPASGDDVVITAGGTTTLDAAVPAPPNSLNSLTVNGTLIVGNNLNVNFAAASSLTVNSGGTMTIGNSATARLIVVTGNVAVSGTLAVGATAATHTLTIGGNFNNSGTVNLEPTATRVCNVTFNQNGNQTVSGSGSYNFNKITLNMGTSNANILDMQASFTAVAGFLTITNGTYKHDSPSNATPWSAAVTIPATGGFWLNNAAAVITTTAGINVTVNGGLFMITTGTMTIGNSNSTRLILGPTAGTLFEMDGGSLTVTGGIGSSTVTDPGTFTFTGGTITVQTINGGPVFSWQLGSATTLNWSGGTFIAANGDGVADDVDIRSAVQNVTGGLLQLGTAGLASVNAISIINGAGGALNLPSIVAIPQQAAAPTALTLIDVHSTPVNILGGITIGPFANFDPNGGVVMNLGSGANSATWTNNGTATMGSSTIVMTGSGTGSFIGGSSATTFGGLTINNPNGVNINTTPTVSAALTLTSGKIFTGANQINLGTAGTVVTPSAASYVVGPVQKSYNVGALALVYPVGDASNYTPVQITAGTTTTAGTLLVSTLTPDQPQIATPIASTVIDANNDVNRYWRFTNTGLTVGTALTATFNFVASDLDPTANPAGFIVQRYDGSVWNWTNLIAANPLSTQASNITTLIAGNNDFAIGDILTSAAPGAFNAFETVTPAGFTMGRIYTKRAGVAIPLNIVALNAARNAVNIAYNTNPITVSLLDAHDNSGALAGGTGCRSSWTTVIGTPQVLSPAWASGRAAVTITAPTNVWRDVRVIVTQGTNVGCSTDDFAIRPQSLTISAIDTNWQTAFICATAPCAASRPLANIGANNGNVHKASETIGGTPAPFTLRVTPVPATATNYSGAPIVVTGFPNCTGLAGGVCTNPGALAFNGGAWVQSAVAVAGVMENPTAYYSEAGVFNLQLQDTAFAAVDAGDGQPATTTTVPSTATAAIGRFVPDHFSLAAATGNQPTMYTFNSTCPIANKSFTYLDQPFSYSITPAVTITARDTAGTPATNYTGSLWKLGSPNAIAKNCLTNPNADTCVFTASVGATNVATMTYNYTVSTGVMPNWDNTQVTPAIPQIVGGSNGTGTLGYAANASDVFAFLRNNTPRVPFNATITFTPTVTDSSETAGTGVPVASSLINTNNPPAIGVTFDAGTEFRYGRMRMSNANGSELLPLKVGLTTQFYQNLTGFVTNAADNCTTVANADIGRGNFRGGLTAAQATPALANGGTFIGGLNTITLSAPGAGHNGAMDMVMNLGSTVTPVSCVALPGVTATGASLAFLRDVQSCSAGAYTQDPTARITFGVDNVNPNSIYLRENY